MSMKLRPVPNWRVVMRRSYSFTLAALATLVGVGAALQPLMPALIPYLAPETAVGAMTVLAGLAAVGRLMDQGLDKSPPRPKP